MYVLPTHESTVLLRKHSIYKFFLKMQVTVDSLTQNYSLHNFITWKSRDKTRDKIFTTPPSLGWISIVQCTYSLYNITGMLKGGGGSPWFFVKLGFEIAVDQQTRTGDRTFEGVPDPNRQTVPAGQPRPYLVQIRPNLAKYPEHAQNTDFRCLTCS